MQFQLKVIQSQSAPRIITLEASSKDEAYSLAQQQGLTVLRVDQKGRYSKPTKFPLLLFCQELRMLLNAGLTLTEALETLIQKESSHDYRIAVTTVLTSLNQGRTLSDAFASLPQCFPDLFVASVKACEKTGDLAEGLQRYTVYLEQIDILKKRIISASIYPALVLAFGGMVLLFLLGYVVPRFSQIYESRSTDLSFAADMLLNLGQMVEAHGVVLLITLVGIGVMIIIILMQENVRAAIGRAITRLPQVGRRVRVYHLSRFYRTFAMLLRSGIPIVHALDMVNQLLGTTLQLSLLSAQKMIREGQSFTHAMSVCGLTTPVALQLFRVGEKSGRLDVMMERAANFHEEELMRWVDAFTKVFEPLLMAAIGILIGFIVLMMYLPIFELASGIQ